MLDRLLFPGINGLVDKALSMGKLDESYNYIEYEIDTDLPLKAPVVAGDADLWARMQNYYFAEVKISKEFRIKGDNDIHVESYDMIIHCDTLLPYDRIVVTFQQAIAEFLGPANRIVGTVKILRKKEKYKFKEGWWIVKDTPMMNVHQK